jgi:hypothetical protein
VATVRVRLDKLQVRARKDEIAAWRRASREDGMTLSAWTREWLNAAVRADKER